MKNVPEMLEELTGALAATNARIDALVAKAEEPEPEETEEEKKKREEEEEAARVAAEEKAEEDKKKDDEMKALAADVESLKTALSAPGVAASVKSVQAGSDTAANEGGQAGDGAPVAKMTRAEAIAAYNKIDSNDAKARAGFRDAHAEELGLRR